jgi:hypothetical protein
MYTCEMFLKHGPWVNLCQFTNSSLYYSYKPTVLYLFYHSWKNYNLLLVTLICILLDNKQFLL